MGWFVIEEGYLGLILYLVGVFYDRVDGVFVGNLLWFGRWGYVVCFVSWGDFDEIIWFGFFGFINIFFWNCIVLGGLFLLSFECGVIGVNCWFWVYRWNCGFIDLC